MADMSFSSFRPVTESSSNVYYATVCYHLLYFSKMKDDNFCRLCFFRSFIFYFILVSGAENRKGATSCSQECIPNIYSFSSEDVVVSEEK
jgi:hypothetical protein